MAKERKNITIEPSVWDLAIIAAAAARRSVSNYIEQLIVSDSKGKKTKAK